MNAEDGEAKLHYQQAPLYPALPPPTTTHAQTQAAQASVVQPGSASQPSWQQYNSVFTAAKAGMQNVDKEKVKKTVYEMSKDSAHFKNEQRKQAQVDARIARLKAKAASMSAAELAMHQKSTDAKLAQLEATRDLTRTWLHVDMDAFFASVEELDQPELKDKPMAVGGMGMISTANYEARKYGVRSAMPGFIARKLCPQLVFVKPNFRKYEAASAATREVFKLYDPHFVAGSLDEAYLDVTDYCSSHGMSGEQVAAELRERVTAATRLTCSVGIAPNATLAKVASDLNKPNGQAVVGSTRDAVMTFVHDLPIRKIPGIGKVSEQTLNALGVTTCGQLLGQRALLAALFSNISIQFFLSVGLGLGQTEHGSSREQETDGVGRKGISCERTFAKMSSVADMQKMAETLVQHLAEDMDSEGIEAKTLTLKLKTTAFEVRTRAVTLPTWVRTAEQMLLPILKLLKAELPVEIRLMGVRGSALRKVHKPGDALAAAGGKLNALQRMILQSKDQQQQLHYKGACSMQQRSSHHEQQQQQQHGQQQARSENDTTGQVHTDAVTAAESIDILDSDDSDVGEGAHSPGSPQLRADIGSSVMALQQQGALHGQQQQSEQDDWQQWQQLSGPIDQLAAEINILHHEQQQQQQHQWVDAPTLKRRRVPSPQQDALDALGNTHQQQLWVPGIRPAGEQQQQQQQQQIQPDDPGAMQCHPQVQQPTTVHEKHCLQQQQQQQQQGQEAVQRDSPLPTGQWHSASQLPGKQQHSDTGQLVAATAAAVQPGAHHRYSNTGGMGSMGSGVGGDGRAEGNYGNSRQHALNKAKSTKPTWTCLACTYSGNRQVMLRCDVCETPKGSNCPPARSLPSIAGAGAASTAVASRTAAAGGSSGGGVETLTIMRSERSSAHAKEQKGRRSLASGAVSSKTGAQSSKQLTLDAVVLPSKST